jgi:NTE family protein
LSIDEAVLRDQERHFTRALSRDPDPRRIGHYKNATTNRLDAVLDRLEVIVRQ